MSYLDPVGQYVGSVTDAETTTTASKVSLIGISSVPRGGFGQMKDPQRSSQIQAAYVVALSDDHKNKEGKGLNTLNDMSGSILKPSGWLNTQPSGDAFTVGKWQKEM